MRHRLVMRAITMIGGAILAASATVLPASAETANCCMYEEWPFAGYTVADTVGVQQVSATWTQPAANCVSAGTYMDFMVSMNRYAADGRTRLDARTGTAIDCASGSPAYLAFYQVAGFNQRIVVADPVAPGDRIRATLDNLGAKQYRFTIENLTRGWREQAQLTGALAAGHSYVGVERQNGFPNFGKVDFVDAAFDGKPIGDYNPNKDWAVNGMSGIDDQVDPGALVNGRNFSPIWLKS